MQQPEADPASSPLLGGFLVFRQEGEERWAALLVIDTAGIPHEFLYAGPARPTRAQALLYGDALESQLRLQMLLRPLLKALRATPACLLSREELPGPLPLPVGVCGDGGLCWMPETGDRAAAAARRFAAALGDDLSEPFRRAEAALRYVIDYETGSHSRPSGPATS